MKSLSIILLTAVMGIALFAFNPSESQQQHLEVQKSKFVINGSANVGSWYCDLEDKAKGELLASTGGSNMQFESLELTLPVEEFSCSDGSRMENNMYDYLKSDEHPNITYELNRTHPGSIEGEGEYLFYGTLTVAGKSKNVRSNVTLKNSGGNWIATGVQDLNMTDFDIDPPRAMFGAVRARDEIEIEYTITFR